MTKQTENLQITIGRDELKALIQEAVRETLIDMFGEDLNSEPNFVPEVTERLRKYQREKPAGIPIDDVVKELGLDA